MLVQNLSNKKEALLSQNSIVIGISESFLVIGEKNNFAKVKLPTIYVYFLYVLLKDTNILRVFCINSNSYFDVPDIAQFNQWQFDNITNYSKDKLLVAYQKMVLEELKKSKQYEPLKKMNKEMLSEYFKIYQQYYCALNNFDTWYQYMSQKQKGVTCHNDQDLKSMITMTQTIFQIYSYLPQMLRFLDNYEHPEISLNSKTESLWL